MAVENLITEHIDIWTSAVKTKSTSGRGSGKKLELYGVKKLRELILELAVRGKLVPQDPNDEPASVLLERIATEKTKLIKDKKLKKQKSLGDVSNNEAPFELPLSWKWTRLSEIAEIGPRNTDVADDTDASFVPMPMISTSYKGEHDSEVKSWKDIKKGYTHFSDGDIALAKITPCFENSKAAVFSNLKNGIGAGTTELHVARPFTDAFEALFVLLYLKAPMFLKVGETKMTGSAGQKRVPKDYFSENPLPFPPLNEQHRIVAKVDELMKLCDQLEQQTEASIEAHQVLVTTLLDTLTNSTNAEELMQNWQMIAEHFDTLFTTEESIDQLKQTILQLAVMGKLVPQDPNDEPAAKLLERIAKEKDQLIKEKKLKKQKALPPIADDEKPFELPQGWEWCRLGSILQMISDYHANGGYKILKENVELLDTVDYAIMLRTTNFSSKNYQEYKYITEKAYHFLEKSKLFPGDIIMNKIGDPGATFYVDDRGQPMSLAMNLFLLRTQIVDSELVYLYLFSSYEYIRSFANGTSTKTITKEAVANLVFPLAPLGEQVRILKIVKEMILICEQFRERLNKLKTTQIHVTDAIVERAV